MLSILRSCTRYLKMSLVDIDDRPKYKYKEKPYPNPTLYLPRANSWDRIKAGVILSATFSGNFGWCVGKLHDFKLWGKVKIMTKYGIGGGLMAAMYFPLSEVIHG
jgi:hypothetical protein